jgi:RpiR family carbohydrate utilization transcriptional regulator
MKKTETRAIVKSGRAGFALTAAQSAEDIISTIKQSAGSLRPSERRVAETVLADVNFAVHSSNSKLARRAGVSEPTVTRFSHAVGCAGVRALKVKLAQSLVVGRIYLEEPPHVGSRRAKPTLWQTVFEQIHLAVNTAERQIHPEAIERAAAAIAGCRRLISFGVGGGATSAALEIKHRFFRLDVAVTNSSDAQLMLMIAATLGKDDVVLAISAGGKAAEVVRAVTVAKQYGARIVTITKPNSPLAKLADIAINLYVPEAPDALKPTASRYAFLAAIDLLAASTAYRRPRETQEYMRRIKYELVHVMGGDADGPLGD